MEAPLISIIIPCFNQAEYLEDALISVQNQTFKNWECIIINDGSPDNTEEIAKEWIENDKRFKYLFQENGGVSSARNLGISNAKGEFILPLDADDKISSEYISRTMEVYTQNPDSRLVYCQAKKMGENEVNWNLPSFKLSDLAKENIIFVSGIFKRKDAMNIGGYDRNMVYGLEDWEFWISLLKSGGVVHKLDHTGFYYRVKKKSRNTILKGEKLNQMYNYLSLKHVDFFITYLGSFQQMQAQMQQIEAEYSRNLRSEKYVIDLFCKRFLGLTVFGKYKGF
jgi:glycosyltransferase involved in cell wall biosynthesis